MANYHGASNRNKVNQIEERQIEERRKTEKLKEEQTKKVAQDIANVKAEHRFQVMLVLLGVAATLLIEHFMEIFDFLKRLLHL